MSVEVGSGVASARACVNATFEESVDLAVLADVMDRPDEPGLSNLGSTEYREAFARLKNGAMSQELPGEESEGVPIPLSWLSTEAGGAGRSSAVAHATGPVGVDWLSTIPISRKNWGDNFSGPRPQ